MTDFTFNGAWWHSPSILEPMPGPWCGYEIHHMDVVKAWKCILDWHKERGFDSIITQISSHFRDRTILGWGFQYVLPFGRNPEARTFSDAFVERNHERMSRILDYAKQIGIAVFIHHYNFMAPRAFVEAHPELHAKWKINDREHDGDMGANRAICDRIGTLYGNICWREPAYKEFMINVWDELFTRFPQISGILTTPGENQYCLCDDCTRTRTSDDIAERYRARKETASEFLSDFCRTFDEQMKRHNKLGVMRLWGIQQHGSSGDVDETLYPKSLPYMVKYHWFDVMDTGPDPIIAEWIAKGYDVWVSKELWGENAGPVQWSRPAYVHRVVDTCRELGVKAVFSHQNNDWGTSGIPGWLQGRILVQFSDAFQEKPFDEKNEDDVFVEKFGPAGKTIRQAAELYSDFVFHVSKIVKIGGEGYTFNVPHKIYPSTGRVGNPVDDWVRGEMSELADYMEYAEAHGWDGDLFETRNTGDNDPFTVLKRMQRSAEKAIAMLDDVRSEVREDALGEFDWIQVSARLCLHQAQEYEHVCRAAVLRTAWLSETTRQAIRDELANRTIAELEAAIQAARYVLEDLLELPTPTMDFSRTVRCARRTILDNRSFYLGSREHELKRFQDEIQKDEFQGVFVR